MLNHKTQTGPIIMTPEGSLNQLPVSGWLLHPRDPFLRQDSLTGKTLVSSQSLSDLLHYHQHSRAESLRAFIVEFDPEQADDSIILELYAHRFSAVIKTARSGQHWQDGSDFQRNLHRYWQDIQTLVLSGGLTTPPFGQALAEQLEQLLPGLDVINSPWGGHTALYGLAHTLQHPTEILVMDFGATGIKRGVASKYGNRLLMLPELSVEPFKHDGLIRKEGLLEVLRLTQSEVNAALPVAISLACYLQNGHPYDYHSGVYHRLGIDAQHLHTDLNDAWLPATQLGELLLLAHDSTAAAMAFRMPQPAMMVTLGTGLGSAPCPRANPITAV